MSSGLISRPFSPTSFGSSATGDAEELTQETFVRACGAAVRFRGDAKVTTWLFGIARRVLLEASRAGLFERRPVLADDAAAPTSADASEDRLDLVRALAGLGFMDREALVMVDMLAFEPIEVATMLGSRRKRSGCVCTGRAGVCGRCMDVVEQPVLDLRSLASVEAPEVVSAALRRFRRRLVVRGLWAALALLVAALSLVFLSSSRGLPERIMGASRISFPAGNPGDGLYEVRGVRFVVLEVADLGGNQLGVHIVGAPDPASQTVVTTVSLPGDPQWAGRYASSD